MLVLVLCVLRQICLGMFLVFRCMGIMFMCVVYFFISQCGMVVMSWLLVIICIMMLVVLMVLWCRGVMLVGSRNWLQMFRCLNGIGQLISIFWLSWCGFMWFILVRVWLWVIISICLQLNMGMNFRFGFSSGLGVISRLILQLNKVLMLLNWNFCLMFIFIFGYVVRYGEMIFNSYWQQGWYFMLMCSVLCLFWVNWCRCFLVRFSCGSIWLVIVSRYCLVWVNCRLWFLCNQILVFSCCLSFFMLWLSVDWVRLSMLVVVVSEFCCLICCMMLRWICFNIKMNFIYGQVK